MKELTHTNSEGKARMVDVGDKPNQRRVAKAKGHIRLLPSTIDLIQQNSLKKGDVLVVAELAGIQAAKKTADLIPLCHSISLTKILVIANIDNEGINISSEIHSTGQTGVEMEALTAVSVGLLTIYDMCKAVDHQMVIEQISLEEKTKTDI